MSKFPEQPPQYQPIPLEPTLPPYDPHGPPPAGFAYPQQSLGAAYPGPPQSTSSTQPSVAFQPNVVHVQPMVSVVTPGPSLPLDPATVTCHSCHERITTRVENTPNMQTHLVALLCCICGLWPCCFFPYCIKSCMSANHYCPKCNTFIGQGINR